MGRKLRWEGGKPVQGVGFERKHDSMGDKGWGRGNKEGTLCDGNRIKKKVLGV